VTAPSILSVEVTPSLGSEVRRIRAYLRKEWLLQLSYGFPLLSATFGVFTTLATYFFIDRLFGRQLTPELAPFAAPYFAYAVVGNAFLAYVGTAIGGLSRRVGVEQSLGTLEVLLATPTRLWVLILAIAVWNTIYASADTRRPQPAIGDLPGCASARSRERTRCADPVRGAARTAIARNLALGFPPRAVGRKPEPPLRGRCL